MKAGTVKYLIEAQTKGLTQAAAVSEKLVASLEKTAKSVNRLATAFEKSTSKSGKAIQTLQKKEGASAKATLQLQEKKVKALNQGTRAFDTQISKIVAQSGKGSQAAASLSKSFQALQKNLKKVGTPQKVTALQENFNTVVSRSKLRLQELSQASKRAGQTTQQSSALTKQASGTQEKLRQRTIAAVQALKKLGASDADVKKLDTSFSKLSTQLGSTDSSFKKNVQATKKFGAELNKAEKSAKALEKKGVVSLQTSVQDLNKSVQLALGPLSGVASRLSALSGLFSANNLVLASAIGLFTGFTVLLAKSITAASLAEKQIRRIEGVFLGVGDSAEVATLKAAKFNDLARQIGRDTLSSAGQVREAVAALATFGNVGADAFGRTLTAAQGLSAVLGGDLQSNVRRLGRVLDRPTENLTSLREAGIQFTEGQKDLIEILEKTGDVVGAQEVLFEKLQGVTEAAKNESKGLAGAVDTLGENFTQFLERMTGAEKAVSGQASAIGALTESVNELSAFFVELAQNQAVLDRTNRALAVAFGILGSAAVGLARNVDILLLALSGLFLGSAVKGAISFLGFLRKGLIGLKSVFFGVSAATIAAKIGITTFGTALRAALGPIGLLAGLAFALFKRFTEVEEQNGKTADSFDTVSAAARELGTEIDSLSKKALQLKVLQLELDINESKKALNSLFSEAFLALRFLATNLETPKLVFAIGADINLNSSISELKRARDRISEVLASTSISGEPLKKILALQSGIINAIIEMETLEEAKNKLGEGAGITQLSETINELKEKFGIGGESVKEFGIRVKTLASIIARRDKIIKAFRDSLEPLKVKNVLTDDQAKARVAAFKAELDELQFALEKGPAAFKEWRKEQKKTAKDLKKQAKLLDKVTAKLQEELAVNASLVAQQKALSTGGLPELERAKAAQALAAATRKAKSDLEGLNDVSLATLAKALEIPATNVDELASALARSRIAADAQSASTEKMTSATKQFNETVPGAVRELENLQARVDAFQSGGEEALTDIINVQKITEAGDEFAKLAEDVAKPGVALLKLKKQFPEVLAGVTTLEEGLKVLGKQGEILRQKLGDDSFVVLTKLADGFGNAFSDAIGQLATGGKSGSEILADLASSIQDLIIQILVVEPLAKSFAKAIRSIGGGGGGIGGFLTTVGTAIFGGGSGLNTTSAGAVGAGIPNLLPSSNIPTLPASAKGNAFSMGRQLQAFAKGGIVDSPTLFPMARGAGLMGEEGPEAVIPLARGQGGRLGVTAEGLGGGGNTFIEIIDQRGANAPQVETSRRQQGGDKIIRVLVRQEIERNINSGGLDKTLGRNFNLQRNPVNR